jgi:hypothetical protein
MQAIELDWEFNAPHWCDFSQEDVGNPDTWFDEEAAKLADSQRIPLQPKTETEHPESRTPAVKRKATRIPVMAPRRLKSGGDTFGHSMSEAQVASKLGKAPSSGDTRLRTICGKHPTRIPLSERRNNAQ